MNNQILRFFVLGALCLWWNASAVHGQNVKVGDQVEFERFGKKIVGTVESQLGGGQVYSIKYKKNGSDSKTVLPATRFKVIKSTSQPTTSGSRPSTPVTNSGGSATNEFRFWTDQTGKFKVKAKFVEQVADSVRLEKEDGRLITVPVAKLSDFDQKYLETAKAAGGDSENPFAGGEMKSNANSGSNTTNNSNAGTITLNTITPNVTAGRKLILISNGQWNVIPDAETPSNSNPQPVEHGPGGFEKPFFDKVGNFIVSPDEKVAAVSITNAFGGDRTGIQFLDLEAGKLLSNVAIPIKDASLIGIIMDPPTFVTTKNGWGSKKGRIDFWDGSDGLRHVKGWEATYKVAKLLNNGELFTIDDKGQAVVWDWKTAKAKYYFSAHAHVAPAISANGKQAAVAVSTGIMILDLDTGKPLGTLSTKKRVSLMAFSRDGAKLSTIQDGNFAVWDLAKGELVDEFAVAGITPFNPSMVWTDDENILVNGSALVNYRLRVPVWNYKVVNGSMPLQAGKGGRFWYSVKGKDGKGTIIPVQLPQDEVLEVSALYDPKDFLVIKPGMKVSIRMNLPFNRDDQEKIYQSVSSKLEANGCTVDPNSPIVLNCFTEKGKTQTREYRDRGGFGRPFGGGTQKVTFTPTICYMEIAKGTDVLWKRSVSSGPGFMMFLKEGESIQQAANNQSKPSPHFFTGAKLPKYYARLPDGKKALGQSELTENGIR